MSKKHLGIRESVEKVCLQHIVSYSVKNIQMCLKEKSTPKILPKAKTKFGALCIIRTRHPWRQTRIHASFGSCDAHKYII